MIEAPLALFVDANGAYSRSQALEMAGSLAVERGDLAGKGVLLLMGVWLMSKANSSTALVCWALGVGLIWVMRFRFALRQVRYLGTFALVAAAGLFMLYAIPGLLEAIVGALGEDMTFTGRTDLWKDLLSESINPLMGTAFMVLLPAVMVSVKRMGTL